MANKPMSMFGAEAAKRQKEQETLEASLTNKPEKSTNRKERMNIVLPSDCKKRLMDYARRKSLSASVVIQMLINDYLD